MSHKILIRYELEFFRVRRFIFQKPYAPSHSHHIGRERVREKARNLPVPRLNVPSLMTADDDDVVATEAETYVVTQAGTDARRFIQLFNPLLNNRWL